MVDDELFRKLAATRAAYEDATDRDERDRLEAELTAIRAEVAEVTRGGLDTMTDEQLAREIQRHERELSELHRRKLDPSMAFGGTEQAGGGFDPLLLQQHNQRVDAQGNRAALEKSLIELRAESTQRAAGTS